MYRLTTCITVVSMLLIAQGCTATRQRIALSSELLTVDDDRVRSIRLVDGSQIDFAYDGAVVRTAPSLAVVGVAENGQSVTIEAAKIATADIETDKMSVPFWWITIGAIAAIGVMGGAVAG